MMDMDEMKSSDGKKTWRGWSEAQARAQKKYIDKFDTIKIRVPKGGFERWKQYADREGKSVNRFVIDLVEAAIAKTNL